MRIVQINMMHTGSTGKIMFGIASSARKDGNAVRTFSPVYNVRHGRMTKLEIAEHEYFGFAKENMLNYIFAKLSGIENLGSFLGTLQLINEISKFEPDIVHLHDIHNYTIHLPLLFHYLKKKKIQVIWTLHDCWAFTGRCSHFLINKCEKWKVGCGHCEQIYEYPRYYLDQTKTNWRLKKQMFTGIQDLVLIAPSKWLSRLTEQSYLGRIGDIYTIENGIDLNVFRPVYGTIAEKYNIEKKKIILGVAFDWETRKGLDVFVELAQRMNDHYQIMLVGTNEKVDKKLPDGIVSIHRTYDQYELAEIYSTAAVFVNPTREDNFPTVNIEALACGTPVVTFNTGGSPEILDETCGVVVPCDDIPALEKAIRHVVEDKPFTAEACRKRAEKFDMQDKFAEYVQLYHDLYEKK